MTHHEHDESSTRRSDDQGKRSFEARMEDFRGRVKKAAGELFDDDELRDEGTLDRLSANVKETLNTAVDRAKEFVSPSRRDDGHDERTERR